MELNDRQIVELACKTLAEKKAVDIKIIEVVGMTDITDYFIVCSGRSMPQVKALCVFFVADGLVADTLGFIEHFLRENMRNAVLLYNGIGADTRRAAAAEDLLHACICPVTAVILLQRCHDLVAVFRAV